jgi:hypothetical protein
VASVGARAAADAVVVDDRDLAGRQTHDAVDAAEQAHGIVAVAARRREHEVLDLQPAKLQATVLVAAGARVDAVVAEGALRLIDDEDLSALGDAHVDEHVDRERLDRALLGRLRRDLAEGGGAGDALDLKRACCERLLRLGVAAQDGEQIGARGPDHLRAAGRHDRERVGALAEQEGSCAEKVAFPEIRDDTLHSRGRAADGPGRDGVPGDLPADAEEPAPDEECS